MRVYQYTLIFSMVPFLSVGIPVAYAKELPLTYTNSIGMNFRLIPDGTLVMGSSPNTAEISEIWERPAHKVEIAEPFYMQTTEVTQRQWMDIMGSNPSRFAGDSHPVEHVSWDDIQTFLSRLNRKANCNGCYRLPTEAQWEYAYRAGTTSTWPHGNDATNLKLYAWYDRDEKNGHYPVKQLNPNPWGLFDMGGNVLEMVEDCYHENYEGAPTNGSAWNANCEGSNEEITRVARGGNWYLDEYTASSASRKRYDKNFPDGFRVVLSKENRYREKGTVSSSFPGK